MQHSPNGFALVKG